MTRSRPSIGFDSKAAPKVTTNRVDVELGFACGVHDVLVSPVTNESPATAINEMLLSHARANFTVLLLALGVTKSIAHSPVTARAYMTFPRERDKVRRG
jgi:hypothetical protein